MKLPSVSSFLQSSGDEDDGNQNRHAHHHQHHASAAERARAAQVLGRLVQDRLTLKEQAQNNREHEQDQEHQARVDPEHTHHSGALLPAAGSLALGDLSVTCPRSADLLLETFLLPWVLLWSVVLVLIAFCLRKKSLNAQQRKL